MYSVATPAESDQQLSPHTQNDIAAAAGCKSSKSRTSLILMSSPCNCDHMSSKCDLLLRRGGNVKVCRPTRSHRRDWRASPTKWTTPPVRMRIWNSDCPPPHQLWRMWWWKMNQPCLWPDSLPVLNLTPLACPVKETSSNLFS